MRELIEILISTDVNLFVHEVVVICCSLYREDAYNFDIASLIVSSCVFSQRCDRLTVSFLHKRCTFLFRRLLRELCILFFLLPLPVHLSRYFIRKFRTPRRSTNSSFISFENYSKERVINF